VYVESTHLIRSEKITVSAAYDSVQITCHLVSSGKTNEHEVSVVSAIERLVQS
jgi:hypothetical protein